MHGVKKVQTTAEQDEQKNQARRKKQESFIKLRDVIFGLRESGDQPSEGMVKLAELLAKQPDWYTMWNYRREILSSLMTSADNNLLDLVRTELQLTLQCLMEVNPKSYCAWFHRAWVLEQVAALASESLPKLIEAELQLCAKALEIDRRNFHVWDHRRWVSRLGNISVEKELEYSDAKIKEDFSNYSNWHFRSKMLPSVYPPAENSNFRLDESKLKAELDLVQNAFYTDPEDSSSWFYHQWLLEPTSRDSLSVVDALLSVANKRLVVCLSHSMDTDDARSCLKLAAHSTEIALDWTTLNPELYHSHSVLCATLSEAKMNALQSACGVSLELVQPVDSTLLISNVPVFPASYALTLRDDNNYVLSEQPSIRPDLRSEFQSIMSAHEEMCRKLVDFEPTKWPILSLIEVLLQQSSRDEELRDMIEQICTLDPKRKQFYDSLFSRFVVRNRLVAQQSPLNLSSLQLQRVPFVEYMTSSVRELDLSDNRLKNADGLSALQLLEVLDIRNNPELLDISDIINIPSLRRVDLTGCDKCVVPPGIGFEVIR